jgi:hypothetical protein
VPFRLTPNLQTLIGPLAVEGIFTASLMAIARCLAEPDNGYEMTQMLSVFVRDEVFAWIAGRAGSSGGQDKMNSMMEGGQLRELVGQNCEIVVKKALFLGVTQHDVGAAGSAPNVNGVNGSSGNGEGSSSATASAANGATGATGSGQAGAVQPPTTAPPGGSLPASQTVVDMISKATNPEKLSQMDGLWAAWL